MQTDRYTIAWFKLAEFVGRKEKERALGIYRLLAHSLHDEGLALQLEGDLLLSFSDEKAIYSYNKAALAYERNQKFIQAAALYEYLIFLQPNTIDYAYSMLKLYYQIGTESKILKSLYTLAQSLIVHNKLDNFESICGEIPLTLKHLIYLYKYSIIYMIDSKIDQASIYLYLDKLLALLLKDEKNEMELFLSKLNILDSNLYDYACTYLAK